MSAKDLESSLREGGEKVGEGRIRIDSARALQRLRDFRFADPAHWVLEVLRAATLSHAKYVDVRTDADDVEVSFDGKAFPPELMKSLLEQALNAAHTPDEKRTRLLSLGVAGALGVTARFVKVSSGGVQLSLSGDQVEVSESKQKGTHLHLRKAFGWRVAAAFLRGAPEEGAIRTRAHRMPATLTLNGAVIAAKPSRHVALKVLEGKGWRIEAKLPLGAPLATSRIEFDVGGVLVAEREKLLPGLQLQAWLRADALRRNASGSDVVDDDEIYEAALVALRKVSRELLAAHGEELAEDPAWREAFLHKLSRTETLDDQARKLIHELRLLPGPAGEFLSLSDVAQASRDRSCVYTARKAYPKGSYPEGTVLLAGDLTFASLLPPGKRVDVAAIVKSKQAVALKRQAHEQGEVEQAVLANRSWVARAKIDATAVEGEVGFESSGNGAFVRVLHKGRLMESGELTTLAPLRLRAVLDWNRPLGDSYFEEEGGLKLLGLVVKYVEHTATKAIVEALPNPEVFPHAIDLLTRLVVNRNVPLAEVPKALREAPLFGCHDGTEVSLATLEKEPRWCFVNARPAHGLLDGARVLVVTPAQRDVLRKLGPKKVEEVSAQLRDEEDVRRRLAAPKQAATIGDLVKVKLEGEGLSGEVGIPKIPGTKLKLSLLKSGLLLETTEFTARYHHAIASVDCEGLVPNAKWNGATRDETFKRVTTAVHDAQRKLAGELVKLQRHQWPMGAELFFQTFLKKELTPLDPSKFDDLTRAVANAPIFSGAHGHRSLLQLKEQVGRDGHFYVVTANRPQVPKDFEVLVEPSALAEVLGEIFGKRPENPTSALSAIDARRRLQALPVAQFKLPSSLALQCRITEPRFTVLAALREGVTDQAVGSVHLDGRVYAPISVPCALPLEVLIDAPAFEPSVFRELSGEQRNEVARLVAVAMQAVVQRALSLDDADPSVRRVLLLALAHRLELSLPSEDAEALKERALFPCTDGRARSYRELDGEGPQFVTTAVEGELPNRRPIIVAAEPTVRIAVNRWTRAEKVDAELAMQLSALRQRAHVEPVKDVVSKAESPWRQRVRERDLTGEIVVTAQGAGRLELFIDKKPLCVLEGALPAPFAGAIDSPRLTPKPGFQGVIDDFNLKEVIDALTGAGERLAAQLASAPRVPAMDAVLVQLAFWVASSLAWQWKGKKTKAKKGKKKGEDVQPTEHPLMAAPLLRCSDGNLRSVQSLVQQQRDEGRVDIASLGGRFLEAGRVAWWPRPDEERWAEGLGFNLNHVTADLLLAESIRQRPRFDEVKSPLQSEWREEVRGASVEGEVALQPLPDGKLVIEVLHERMLLETWSSEHPIGGVARVDSSALSPNEKWTQAKRDTAFKALVTSTEAALERLLVRRLTASSVQDIRPWAIAAVRWRPGQAGPLSAVLPTLPLFSDLNGEQVTLGVVLELARRRGKVPIARVPVRGTFPAKDTGGVVLETPDSVELLSLLGLESEDVTGDLKRAMDLQQSLTTRRLASYTWKGESLVKVPIATGVLTGELAVRRNLSHEGPKVMLAKDGISVSPLSDTWPGVVGIVDVKDLEVNDDWSSAEPTRSQRALIRAQVEGLFSDLAAKAPSFGDEERELAVHWVLRFLLDSVVATAGQLDRVTGVARELADAPLFRTVEGEKVNLRAVAGEVSSRGRVAVLGRSLGVPEGTVSCVLLTTSYGAPWLSALEDFFGKTKVWKVTELDEWRRTVREEDPQEGAPELHGLRFLRREVRLLRAGALGHLTPDDLEDVKLSRDGGAKALRYDKKRKLVLLDPEHPDIARALKEAQQRPERLWVLIAAMFGLVNRELHHVTDAHEAQLLIALAGHLASNPRLI